MKIKFLPGYVLLMIFAYAAADKLMLLSKFQADLLKIYYLPAEWVIVLSYLVPVLELILVTASIFPRTYKFGYAGLLVLLIIFSVHLVVINVYSPSIPCSCGGFMEKLGFTQHLVVNGILTGCCIYSLGREPDR